MSFARIFRDCVSRRTCYALPTPSTFATKLSFVNVEGIFANCPVSRLTIKLRFFRSFDVRVGRISYGFVATLPWLSLYFAWTRCDAPHYHYRLRVVQSPGQPPSILRPPYSPFELDRTKTRFRSFVARRSALTIFQASTNVPFRRIKGEEWDARLSAFDQDSL